MAAAAAEAILVAGSEVAPENQAVGGPAEGLLYEAPFIVEAEARPTEAVRATRQAEKYMLA